MTASYSANRWQRITTAVGVLLVAAGCASRPSLGPNTVTGNPAHVDGGTGQLLRYCETLHDKGKLQMAAAMCERAYQVDPSNSAALLELASILGDMGEIDMAKKAYQAILQNDPGHAEAHYGLGRIHMNAKEYDLALAEFQAGLRTNPKDPRLYNAAGVASGLLGAHTAAQEAFRAGLEVAPNDVNLRNNLGLSLIQTGHYDQGLQMLQAVAKEPKAGETSRDNLNLALSVVTAARAEAVLAENRTHMEARSQAESEARQRGTAMDAPRSGVPSLEAAMVGATDAPTDMSATSPEHSRQWKTGVAMAEEPAPAEPQEIAEPTPLITTTIAKSPSAAKAAPPPPGAAHDSHPGMAGMSSNATQMASMDPTARKADMGTVAESKDAAAPASDQPSEHRVVDRGPAKEMAPEHGQTIAKAAEGAALKPNSKVTAGADDVTAAKDKDRVANAPMAKDRGVAAVGAPETSTFGTGDHAVQLASYTSEDRAWSGWSMIKADAADILGDVRPVVRAANLGSDIGMVYRLRTASAPKAQAQRLCDALKARGIACLVVKTGAQTDERDGTGTRQTL